MECKAIYYLWLNCYCVLSMLFYTQLQRVKNAYTQSQTKERETPKQLDRQYWGLPNILELKCFAFPKK